ncbi:MAG: hypothetical protein B6D38_03640 [Anaerolineae bacterium UTCFX1]|nr:MAG: hypothetical protein B6D38_03640 [Anaerolineae bacterium UTCFX1]
MALSLVNRPDLGKMVLLDNLGELSPMAIEERLKAASHSLLARKFANIGKRGLALLDDELQRTLTPLILFNGMIQVVINQTLPVITNFHLGFDQRCTAHWTEQGVVHRLVLTEVKHLPQLISALAPLPQQIATKLEAQISQSAFRLSMGTFTELTELDFDAGLNILMENGLDSRLAKALLVDLLEPRARGSVNLLPIDSEHMEQGHSMSGTPGLFFVTGKSAWLVTFSGVQQVGRLLAGTTAMLEKCIRELLEKGTNAFS